MKRTRKIDKYVFDIKHGDRFSMSTVGIVDHGVYSEVWDEFISRFEIDIKGHIYNRNMDNL